MIPVFTLIVILALSMLITKIATIALTYTGLSKQAAQFQARSAFTGVGFTTGEAEAITNHPVRRKIVSYLMITGNVGIISAMASLVLTFIQDAGDLSWYYKLLILIAGIAILWIIANSGIMNSALKKIIDMALHKFTKLNIQDYEELLQLSGEYEITELAVNEDDWLVDKTLKNLKLRKEGVNILSVKRKSGKYIGVPDGDTKIKAGDRLIVYGRENVLKEISKRKSGIMGDQEHSQSVEKQEVLKEQEKDEENGER